MPTWISTNSSPPKRATVSLLRAVARRRSATARNNASPTAWPKLSLTGLKRSKIQVEERNGLATADAGHGLLQPVAEEQPVRQVGQGIVMGHVGHQGLRAPPAR